MDLRRLLNQSPAPGGPASSSRANSPSATKRSGWSSATMAFKAATAEPSPAPERPQPTHAAAAANHSPNDNNKTQTTQLHNTVPPHRQTAPMAQLQELCSHLDVRLQQFRAEAGYSEEKQIRSQELVNARFNSQTGHVRDTLWHSFLAHAHLSHALNLPIFPVTPAKAALSQARAVAPLLDERAQQSLHHATASAPPPLGPPGAYESSAIVAEAFYALQVAAQATDALWPGVEQFVNEPAAYAITREVLDAAHEFTIRPATPPMLPMQPWPRHPPAQPTARMLKYFDAAAAPSLSDVAHDLSHILHALRDQPNDPVEQNEWAMRFGYAASQHPPSPEIVFAADLYTALAHLVRFPAWPLSPLKLVVFAFAYSQGSIGRVMDRIVPKLEGRRIEKRMEQAKLEAVLTSATQLWELSLQTVMWDAWAVTAIQREREQWESWRHEIRTDARGDKVYDPKAQPPKQQPAIAPRTKVEPPSRNIKASSSRGSSPQSEEGPSPDSNYPTSPPSSKPRPAAIASLTAGAATTGKKRGRPAKSPQPLSSAVMSKVNSATGSTSSTRHVTPVPPRRKKRRIVRRPTPDPATIPQLPPHRFPPPLPPIIPKAGLVRKTMLQVEEEERSVALNRPRRGMGDKLEMVAVDLEGFWRLQEAKRDEQAREEREKVKEQERERARLEKEERVKKEREQQHALSVARDAEEKQREDEQRAREQTIKQDEPIQAVLV